jgi:hypothetical protein
MNRLSSFVRNSPRLFYVMAAVDLLKNLMAIGSYLSMGRYAGLDTDMAIRLQLLSGVVSAIVSAVSWIAYGVIATILIALFDEMVAQRVAAGDVSNA